MKCLLMSHSSNVLWHNFFGLWIAWFALPKNVNRFSDQHNFPLKYQVQFHCYQIGLFAFKKLAFYDNLYIISVWNDKNLVVRWRDFVTLICHSALSQTIMNWAAIFGAQVSVAFTSSDMSKISYLNSKKKVKLCFFLHKTSGLCLKVIDDLVRKIYVPIWHELGRKNPNRKFPIISSRWASFNISEGKWVFGDLPVPHPKQQFCYSAREVDQSTE